MVKDVLVWSQERALGPASVVRSAVPKMFKSLGHPRLGAR